MRPDDTRASDAAASVSRMSLVCGGSVVFAGTFLLRYITIDFPNDHFVHLSRARQIVLGEVPIRDFFDPGLILQYYASAAALIAAGDTLFGEAILTVSLIAAGTALCFVLAARASGSVPVALVSAVAAAATMPRLYSYPKVFLYALALACGWRYAHGPTTPRLLVLAVVTAAAFLFRPDHGLYIGAATVGLIVLLHAGEPRRVIAALWRYTGVTATLLLPLFVWLTMTVGVANYYLSSDSQARDVTTVRLLRLPPALDRSAPLIAVEPPPERRIRVRWQPDVSDPQRRDREARYRLAGGLADDPPTWSYVVRDDSRTNLQALVADPLVADTHGIDRQRGQLTERESWRDQWRRLLATRLHLGIFTPQNALAWLYYLTIALPVAGGLLLATQWRRRGLAPGERAFLGMTVLLCLLMNQGLVRDNPRVRLPDVATAAGVLGAWVAAVGLGTSPGRTRIVVGSMIGLLTIWSAGTVGGAAERLRASGIVRAPGSGPARLASVTEELRQRPLDVWAPEGSSGIRALTRYVHACTAPEDRVLVTWFEPGVFFYAQRRFAGGQVYLDPGWHDSDHDQRLTVERLRAQRVPIVLVRSEVEALYRERFAIVHDYVQQRYRTAARSTFGGDQEYSVLVDETRPASGRYERFDLPCYR